MIKRQENDFLVIDGHVHTNWLIPNIFEGDKQLWISAWNLEHHGFGLFKIEQRFAGDILSFEQNSLNLLEIIDGHFQFFQSDGIINTK